MTLEYTLPVLASRTSDNVDTISIDFSAKGGPSDLHGTWDGNEAGGYGINWSDGNHWTIVCPLHCPPEAMPEEFLQ